MAEQSETAKVTELAPQVGDIFQAVPKLVQRTASQLDLLRSLAAHVPCVASSIVSQRNHHSPGRIAAEPLDVLDLLEDSLVVTADDLPTVTSDAPNESGLAIHEYDSLAASQVVPRLATLAENDLRAILSYERANRNRQTIIHRLSQLLES